MKLSFNKSAKIALMIGSIFWAASGYANLEKQATPVAWDYSGKIGPAHWGQLDNSFALCATGKLQSPIDISGYLRVKKDPIKFIYHSEPLSIVDDGLTEIKINHRQEVINDGHTIQINFSAKGPQEIVNYRGKDYRLLQFHFHTPSENLYDGVAYPLEIHFVHQGEDSLLVVGVFVIPGAANPALQTIINHLPTSKYKVTTLNNVSIEPFELIPKNTSYFAFDGSLTTPPCSQGVRWIVMKNPITASAEQIKKLKAAVGEANARPVQPMNKRKIEFFK